MNEKTFQAAVKYGAIVLGLCLLLNLWSVMRYREIYRDTVKAEIEVQQLETGVQIGQAVLQEFAAHANSDPHIAEILRQAQTFGASPAAITGQRNQH